MGYSKKELRFWLNWAFVFFVNPLYPISLLGTSTSFHQFVTNPTKDEIYQLNSTNEDIHVEIEPGLGESELFYSLLVSALYFGSMIGGLVTGFLVRSVPYWYLYASAFFSNMVGSIIYCLSHQGWLMMISRLLTGYFLGAIVTTSFSYNTTSSEAYIKVKKELGKQTNEQSAIRVRNYLLSSLSIGFSIGLIIGSGVTVVFAQFESVSQFRTIGWFIFAYSAVAFCLQLIMFHEEMKCKELDKCFQFCPEKGKDTANLGLFSLFIILSLLLLSLIERVRFAFLVTLFNPIASDTFGIDERGGTYFLLALCIPQAAGAIILNIVQRLNVSNKAITLFAIITTILGYLIMTDWQAIPYDPCTEYSPFHHPGITQKLNSSTHSLYNSLRSVREIVSFHGIASTSPMVTSIKLLSNLELNLGTSTLSFKSDYDLSFSCKPTESCNCSFSLPSNCLRFTSQNGIGFDQDIYHCSSNFNLKAPVVFCIILTPKVTTQTPTTDSNLMAKISSIDVLPEELNQIARNNCVQANIPGHQCHWIPDSDIFKNECKDCQPICRSVHQTLTFAQFMIGNCLLMLAASLQFVSIVALLMNQSLEHIQGIVIGSMTALNSITRTVVPLLLDAVYEAMQKRVFLVTIPLALIQVPFAIEVIVLYKKLGPKTKQKDTEDKPQYKYSRLESRSVAKDD